MEDTYLPYSEHESYVEVISTVMKELDTEIQRNLEEIKENPNSDQALEDSFIKIAQKYSGCEQAMNSVAQGVGDDKMRILNTVAKNL